MTTTYTRVYYGERSAAIDRDEAYRAHPNMVRAAEAMIPMLHPDRTHTYAATEPNTGKIHSLPINGSIGWIVTFTPDEPQE